MDQFRAKILLEQKRDQLHLESFMRHDNIQKSQPEDINPFDKFEEDIQKGKKASIGETRVWNGKKVKKIAEGKWVEISSEGKSRKEHEFESNKANAEEHSSNASKKDIETGRLKRIEERHKEQASKLSDKEYTDEEVGLGVHKKGDKLEHNGETIHVGHDTSGGQSTITYKAPSVSDKTYYDLDKLKKVIEENKVTDKEYTDEEVEGGENKKFKTYEEYKKSGGKKSMANAILSGEVEDDNSDYTLEQMNYKIGKSKLANHYNVSPERLKDLKLDGTDTPLELSRALNLPIDDTNFQGVQETIKKMMGSNKKQE